ncbi:DUF4476 domain-containing protein [Fulvivirga lutea]|uniref:DUF4476 domain-containing protein n=1 Tax=Fulvivirga lutea TaxID=2810512 RepID=A0A974ZZU0_9BACT|nr:DUF4476 domain-containing protein [Fulvivirga lutea]QSE96516.1 DUF4476 domain-containing protein [Fulvivirga lutea]
MRHVILSLLLICSIATITTANHCIQPLPEHQFNQLRNSLKPSRSEQFRMNEVLNLVNNYCFNSAQIQSLLFHVQTDHSRITIGKAAFSGVADPHNFYMVYDAFNSFSMAFRLHDIVHNQLIAPIVTPPPVIIQDPVIICEPTPDDFAHILRTIRNESFANDKLSALHLIAPNYCFTVNQIGQIMDAFHFSGGKLSAAKALYDNAIDQHNYYRLVDKIVFRSDKEELRRYINDRRF